MIRMFTTSGISAAAIAATIVRIRIGEPPAFGFTRSRRTGPSWPRRRENRDAHAHEQAGDASELRGRGGPPSSSVPAAARVADPRAAGWRTRRRDPVVAVPGPAIRRDAVRQRRDDRRT